MNARALADEICRTLRAAGHQAYLVGGCVRDILLEREPVDYDVATDATPDRVQKLFPDSLAVGAQFGVVIVQGAVAISRQARTTDRVGRKSKWRRFAPMLAIPMAAIRTTWSTRRSPEEDVRRRDFTINALLLDPETGEVLDFVGGREDLDAGIIRAIGSRGRAVSRRQAAHDCARCALRRASATRLRPGRSRRSRSWRREIHQVSAERIRDELTKLLTEGAARRGFELLDETGLLPEVLPEIARMKGVEQPPQFHPEGDVWIHTLMMLEGLPAGCSADARLGRAAARRGQAADLHAAGGDRATAFGSTSTWKSAPAWPRRSAGGCASRTTIPSRSWRWWPTTCGSRTSSR